MIDLEDILTPELCAEFERLMQYASRGNPNDIDAAECIHDVLRVLSTASGTAKNAEPAEIHIGRGTVIPLLISALVDDEVDPRAWLEALSQGSFDLTPHVQYGSLSRRSAGAADRGSPGTYLPRLLAKLDELDRKSSVAYDPARKVTLKTAVRILIASVLLREMRNKVAARAALGPAWPIMVAVNDHLMKATHRQIDALGADANFQKHLASVIKDAVETYMAALPEDERPPLRTQKQIESSAPAGVDVKRHFDREQEKLYDTIGKYDRALRAEVTGAGIAQPIDLAGNPPAEMASFNAQYWKARIAEAIDEAKILADATRYLDDADKAGMRANSFPPDHVALLQQMMPLAMEPRPTPAMAACGAFAADYCVPSDSSTGIWQHAKLDRLNGALFRRIVSYADRVGPPPPGVPFEHLQMFQAAGCLFATLNGGALAKREWRAIGMFTFDWNTGSDDYACSAFELRESFGREAVPQKS